MTDEERPLLLFDTYERMQAIDGYLRRSLLPSLPERAIVVIAGRAAPGPGWFSAGWENLAAELELDRLTRDEAIQLLRAGGITDEASTERILAWSGGSPLALSLAAARPASPPAEHSPRGRTPRWTCSARCCAGSPTGSSTLRSRQRWPWRRSPG